MLSSSGMTGIHGYKREFLQISILSGAKSTQRTNDQPNPCLVLEGLIQRH